MTYDKKWLINERQSGNKEEFILFWGHHPSQNGKIDKSCLSQWFDVSFIVDNIKYLTAEHWMMAEKARLFKDVNILPEILNAKTPAIVKSLGRKIKNFNEDLWDNYKYGCVKRGNLYKFSQNIELKNYLLSTGNRILVEASPWDSIWGIGLSKEDPAALIPEKWPGDNLLGFALMEARDEIRSKLV